MTLRTTEALRSYPDFVSLGGVTSSQVRLAEDVLGEVFSEEYVDYLIEFGVVAANGHELTGICESPRLDIVSVTKRLDDGGVRIPKGKYVIEELGIDGIVALQSTDGGVFQMTPDGACAKVCESLAEYVSL